MKTQSFVHSLFSSLPNLKTLVFHLNPDGLGVITHLNGVDYRLLTKRFTSLKDEEKMLLVEMDFPLEQYNTLSNLINSDGQMFLTDSFEKRFFFRGCPEALTIKELLEIPNAPFPWINFYQEVKETFNSNSQLNYLMVKSDIGLVRTGSAEVCSQRAIYQGQIAEDGIPPYVENPNSLFTLLASASKTLEDSYFHRREYL